jgi:hypothetical protein
VTAAEIAHALHGRNSGAGWMARCPAHDDRSPSLSIRERDGRLLVHCHAGCLQADVIAALRARGLWAESNLTPAEKRDFARQRAADQADMQNARPFADVATIMAEQALEKLSPTDPERAPLTALLSALRTDTGTLTEYRAWRSAHPKLTAGLVAAGRQHQERLLMLVTNYLTLEVRCAA